MKRFVTALALSAALAVTGGIVPIFSTTAMCGVICE
jgi:hypothetical protein